MKKKTAIEVAEHHAGHGRFEAARDVLDIAARASLYTWCRLFAVLAVLTWARWMVGW